MDIFNGLIEELRLKELKQKIFLNRLKSATIWVVIIAEVFLVFHLLKGYGVIKNDPKGDKIALININKVITTDYGHKVEEQIQKALKDKKVKEILVTLNSPGGSPSASDDISELLKYAKTQKPTTVYIESIAASGGYYIASAIKPLVANKNAIVGSIGVIMPHFVIKRLADKIGIESDDIEYGKFKKPISLFKKVDAETKKYLNKHLLKPTYTNFITQVSKNRGLELETLEKFADGKIYIANDKSIKGILVDKIENLFRVKKEIQDRYPNSHFVNFSETKKKFSLPFNVKLDIPKLSTFF